MTDTVEQPFVLHRLDSAVYLKSIKRILREYRRLDAANDELMRRHRITTGEPITCRSGCNACCAQFVGLWYLEALICVEEATRVGFDIDVKEVQRQTHEFLTKRPTREELFGWRNRCVFLDHDGSCAVHAARPIACRAVNVVTPAGNCESGTGVIRRIDNRAIVQQTYRIMFAEHRYAALMAVVSHLPVMVDLVLKNGLPSDLAKTEGVYGLQIEKRISD